MGSMRLSDVNKTASILTSLDRQRHLMVSIEKPAVMQSVRLQRERQERAPQRLIEPVGLQSVIDQRERTQQLIRSSVLNQLARQQAMLDQLVKGPAILISLTAMPMEVFEWAERYRDARSAEVEDKELTGDNDPLPRLAAEREAILTCLRRIRDSALAAGLLEVPIPPVVLALLVIAVVLGEVADERLLERENDIAV
jgi:hypothetical protein